jgi:uncharacterized repeat protein (TIGR03803 family)
VGGGGPGEAGTVFKLTHSGNGWNEEVIHRFLQFSGDGFEVFSPVTIDASGNLYGTTIEGGENAGLGFGIVYRLHQEPDGHWKEHILHEFHNGDDGAVPYAGVVFDSAGNLYGTTRGGGSAAHGVVFQIKPLQ